MRIMGIGALLLAATAGTAAADPAARHFDWRGEPSATVQLGTGYRAIFPFDEEYCGEDDPDKSYCLGRSPFALDLGLGFGLLRGLEAIATLSIGLEKDFGAAPGLDGPRPLALAPGLRLQLSPMGAGVLWSTLELPIDLTSYDQADEADLGVRNRNAYEFPVARHVGAFVYFGESASWKRWFRFELELGLGVAVRR